MFWILFRHPGWVQKILTAALRKEELSVHADLNMIPTRWQAWSEIEERGCFHYQAEEQVVLCVGNSLVSLWFVILHSPPQPPQQLYSGTG